MANTKDLIGEQEAIDGIINQTLTSIEEDGINQLANYALARNKGLVSVNFPNVITIGQFCFDNCENLISVSLPAGNIISQYCFNNCKKLTTVNMASAGSVQNRGFGDCSSLQGLELPGLYPNSGIYSNAFSGCKAMTWLKLPQNEKVALRDTGAFYGTPINIGFGAIYVPSNLVATYKADNNWKNFFIASIDDYPLTDFSTISDSWTEILAAEANGTYSTKYAIGDTKKVVINGNDVYMQIVAMDADALTGGGMAKITWIAKGFAETHRVNATDTNTDGWAAAEMRTWLRDTVYTGLDSDLKSAIKEVDKTYYDNTSNTTKTVSDTLWIPSFREVGFSTSNASCESSGPIYSGIFTSNSATRIKYNTTTISTASWRLRSAYSGSPSVFMGVNYLGGIGGGIASIADGVVFGFCT